MRRASTYRGGGGGEGTHVRREERGEKEGGGGEEPEQVSLQKSEMRPGWMGRVGQLKLEGFLADHRFITVTARPRLRRCRHVR